MPKPQPSDSDNYKKSKDNGKVTRLNKRKKTK